MADPVVHITGGIPDSGTGNITTLGQTLLDGANVTYGATTDLAVTAGAVGTISAKLRSISRDIAGGIVLQAGANVIGAVTQSGGPWSVSGTLAATQSGVWNITNITGTISLPTGAATSANQPTNAAIASTTSSQSGTLAMGAASTSAPSYVTGQTNPLSLTTAGLLRVDGSGVTQPISGTVTASQGGAPWTIKPDGTAWTQTGTSANVNVTNGSIAVTGTFWQATQPISAASLPLPSGASTAANQATAASLGSTTSGQTGNLSLGAVTTAAPAYTNGQTNALSLSTTGLLRVDGSGATQPVSGGVNATQSGTWTSRIVGNGGASLDSAVSNSAPPTNAVLASGQFNSVAPSITTGNTNALQLDASGNLLVNIKAGAGSGGTASSFGAAFPTTGTAIGAKDSTGTNMVSLNVNASGALKTDSSAVTQPVSGTFWQATQPVSAASLPLPTGAASSTNQPTNAAAASTTLGQTGNVVMGAVTTAAPSYSNATSNFLSLTATGALRTDASATTQPVSGTFWQATQPVSGTITANQGGTWTVQPGNTANTTAWLVTGTGGTFPSTQSGAWNITNITGTVSLPTGAATAGNQPTNAALGSTTSGQTGNLELGAVTSGSPTYTTGQTNALSLTTAGALRVDGSAVTQPVSGTFWQATQPISGTVTANQGGTWNITNISGTVSLPTGASTSANQPTNAAQGSTTSGQTGNLVMGAVTTGNPTYTTAQTSPISLDTSGAVRVNVIAGSGGGGTSSSFGSAFPATGTSIGVKDSAGTNMTFLQANASNALKVDGSAVTQPVSGTVAATQSGNWTSRVVGNAGGIIDFVGQNIAAPANAILIGAEFNTTPTTITSGNASPLQLDSAGNLLVNIKAGAGSGGTASNFGAAFPTAGTAAGAEYLSTPPTLTNGQMVALQTNVSGSLKVDGSAVTQPVSGTFWQTTQPVSAASLPLPSGASTAANQTSIQGVIGAATAPASMEVVGGVFNTTKPTLTTGQSAALQTNASGSLLVDGSAVTQPVSGSVSITGTATVSGTVTANQGGAPWTMKPDGTAWALTGTSANVNVTNASIAVTGTFWQATQPVSIAAAVNVQSSTAPVSTMNSASANAGVNAALAGVFDDVTPTAITENNFGFVRMSANRNIYGTIRDAAGNERGVNVTSGNALTVDGSATTQPVSIAAAVTVQQATAANLKGQFDPLTPANWALGSSTQNSATVGTGQLVLGQFNTSPTAITSGNMSPLQLNGTGSLRVDGSGATQPVSGTVTANQGGTWTVQPGNTANTTAWLVTGTGGTFPATQSGNWTSRIVGNAGATLDTSATQNQAMPTNMLVIGGEFNTSPTAITSGNASPLQLNGSGSLRVDGSGVTQPVSGTFWQATQPVSGTVTVTQGTAANLNATVTGTVAATQSGTWTVQQGTPPWTVNGDTASGATDANNPVKIGGLAKTTNPTAVTDGQRVAAVFDKQGKQVVVGAIRQLKGVQKTSITVATETTVVTAGGAGVFNDVYAIVVTNKSATAVFVDFKDATAGTTRMTLAAPANDTRGFTVPVDSAMIQAVAANNWTATVSSAVTSIEVTVLYVSNT